MRPFPRKNAPSWAFPIRSYVFRQVARARTTLSRICSKGFRRSKARAIPSTPSASPQSDDPIRIGIPSGATRARDLSSAKRVEGSLLDVAARSEGALFSERTSFLLDEEFLFMANEGTVF